MKEFLELQAVVHDGAIVSDVKPGKNNIHFKLDGHKFLTYGHTVVHEAHPLYDHPASRVMAALNNDPVEAEKMDRQAAEVEEGMQFWDKYRLPLFAAIFESAMQVRRHHGDVTFLRYVDSLIEVIPMPFTLKAMKQLVKVP